MAAPARPAAAQLGPTSRVTHKDGTLAPTLAPNAGVDRDASPGGRSSRSYLSARRLLSPRPRRRDSDAAPANPQTIDRNVLRHLPLWLSRFLGYRISGAPPLRPLIPGLDHVSAKVEGVVLGTFACFVGILLAESILIGSPLFIDVWGSPLLVIASLGATAVLTYGCLPSPLSQPRNVIGGHILSALTSIILAQLFRLSPSYQETPNATSDTFTHIVWIQAALSMALSFAVMDLTTTIHPPGGATALIVATTPAVTNLTWRFLLELFACVTVMVCWGCICNNLGRGRYPTFWLQAPPPPGAKPKHSPSKDALASAERGEKTGKP